MLRCLQVRSSGIHGKGVFALETIAKGVFIGTYRGRPAVRPGPFVLWVENDDGTERGISGRNKLRFLNHSRSPNAELVGEDLFSLRRIQPGEEVTIHYGDEIPSDW